MNIGLRDRVLPENQRRTLEELSDDLDLRSGDTRAKQSAFWTMLVLSGIIATAGILADSTATVIGAMIIAPLSTPIMGIALGIVKRERIRAGRFVLAGAVIVVLIGVVAAFVVPDIDLRTNSQITSRTSPTLVDLIAAIATGLAGAVGLSRRDVAAVLPGVAIAISLVPPLAVVGICLGEGSVELALGALLLFVSNLVSMVLAGTVLFAALGYSAEADQEARLVGAERKSYIRLVALLVAVLVPLALNTALVVLLHSWTSTIETVAQGWLSGIPSAEVTDVQFTSRSFRIQVRVPPGELPPTDQLLRDVDTVIPGRFAIVVDTTYGEDVDVGTTGTPRSG
ncbi:MAG: TIGR00341 family protein [Ornithinibacter sp.]